MGKRGCQAVLVSLNEGQREDGTPKEVKVPTCTPAPDSTSEETSGRPRE